MNIAVGIGGGGLKIAYEIGVIMELQNRGHRIVSSDGVSAGALVTALLIQHEWGLLEAVVKGGGPGDSRMWPALTEDVHRWRTGRELAWPMLTRGLRGVDSMGRNDRLWSNYLSRFIDADRAVIPGYVGCVEWNTPGSPYRSIAHDEHPAAWPRAVWGSATIPVIWEPVHWRDGTYLADGGLRTSVPIDDIMDRIVRGVQAAPDLVMAVPTNVEGQPADDVGPGLDGAALHTIGIMTAQIESDDVAAKPWWPDVPHVILRPTVDLGGTLESTPQTQLDRYEHGKERVREWSR